MHGPINIKHSFIFVNNTKLVHRR